MDGPQPKRNRADINVNSDYISNLPADIKEKILAELSLKEAVRASILSSRWKDSWTSYPNLVFEEKNTKSRLIELVDKVLRVHQGPIQIFKLVSEYASNKCVIPSRFFSCNGFTLLHTLCLSHFNLPGFGIEKLVSSCPLLEHLDLNYFSQEGCLRILAPKLTFMKIIGDFHDICLETPKLVEGSICLFGDFQEFSAAKDGKESNFTRALGHLSNIQKLKIRGEFIDYLAMGPIPNNLPAMFNHLSEISVDLISGLNEIAPALCLFQNAPNLKELRIECLDFVDPPYVQGLWESKAIPYCLFKCLKVVNIMCFDDPGSERAESMLEFAKLVLSTAPLLEEFHVTDLGEAIVVFEELKLFPKLSEKCKLVLKYFNEETDDDEENNGDEESDDDDEENNSD
ncbi:F-box/FBD/LRR-repeat protein At1g13570-like [Carex rostrata]